jgi:hypothetical protein
MRSTTGCPPSTSGHNLLGAARFVGRRKLCHGPTIPRLPYTFVATEGKKKRKYPSRGPSGRKRENGLMHSVGPCDTFPADGPSFLTLSFLFIFFYPLLLSFFSFSFLHSKISFRSQIPLWTLLYFFYIIFILSQIMHTK